MFLINAFTQALKLTRAMAEGCGRSSEIEFARFLEIAYASASELQYLALLSKDLELFDSQSYQQITSQVEEVKRMLYTFIQTVKDRSKCPSLKPDSLIPDTCMSSSKKTNDMNLEVKFSIRTGGISKVLHAIEIALALTGIAFYLMALIRH